MAQDTLLGFPAHTFPYRRGEFTTLSTVSVPGAICTGHFSSFFNFFRAPRQAFPPPAVYFTHSVHPSPPQADASASVTCASELVGASCKSRTGCVSSTKISKRVFYLSAETVISVSICSNTLYCA